MVGHNRISDNVEGKALSLLKQTFCNINKKEEKSMRTARTIFWRLTLAVSICITGGLVYAADVLKHETPQYETPPAFVPDQVVNTTPMLGTPSPITIVPFHYHPKVMTPLFVVTTIGTNNGACTLQVKAYSTHLQVSAPSPGEWTLT
jgi:hypothetical protein